VMVDHSFDEVEEAPAEKKRADECLARPRHIAPRPCLRWARWSGDKWPRACCEFGEADGKGCRRRIRPARCP
jgi:hypothetical protein